MSNPIRPSRGERDGIAHLQMPRRPSHRAASVLGRLASTSSSIPSPVIATATSARTGPTELSTSAPNGSELNPATRHLLSASGIQRANSYGGTGETVRPPRRRGRVTDGEALDLATGALVSHRRPRISSSGSMPGPASGSGFRPATRSFLLPTHGSSIPPGGSAGSRKAGGSNKLMAAMAPLSKPKRTTKTSQKLVVLPSGPQTKPLRSKQPVLLDEGEESSDENALPLPGARRRLLPPRQAERVIPAAKSSEGGEGGEQRAKRVREYKSAAERMSKEERKREGYKRITAYCLAEGLKMKVLASFLKREHNVHPRVFDEALYAMYHLPLLPGYGPNINVRSSAPPTTQNKPETIHERLEETEEAGYHDAFFPPAPDGPLDSASDAQETAHDGGMDANLPGLVRAASVEEVRGADGYVTSGSLPPIEAFTREYESAMAMRQLPSSYDSTSSGGHIPYASSPDAPTSVSPLASNLRRRSRELEAQEDEDGVLPTSALVGALRGDASPFDAPDTPSDTWTVESEEPGAASDPGVYGPWPWSPQSQLPSSDHARDKRDVATDEESEHAIPDLSASIRTMVPAQDEQKNASPGNVTNGSGSASDVTAMDRSATARLSETIKGQDSDSPELQGYGSALSAYETQLSVEREREQVQYRLEKEHEKARQLEYEHALARERERERERELDNVAEVVFFDYGVVVFFGLDEQEEKSVLDDLAGGGAFKRMIKEDDWEVEECHFAHDSQIAYPRIYNDFFTLKSRSHLLKLSIAHALAQSTLLARYETLAGHTLSSPLALSIPRQMADSGSLQLRRPDALKLTGSLFKLRRDVNLVSNVLDVPELFWSESSLKELYDAVREYMEIDPRVDNLNEKLGVASDFLDAIHDHLNNSAMDRITRIIIWLIVVAILVELGEILARLVVHSTISKGVGGGGGGLLSRLFWGAPTTVMRHQHQTASIINASATSSSSSSLASFSKAEALETLERMIRDSQT